MSSRPAKKPRLSAALAKPVSSVATGPKIIKKMDSELFDVSSMPHAIESDSTFEDRLSKLLDGPDVDGKVEDKLKPVVVAPKNDDPMADDERLAEESKMVDENGQKGGDGRDIGPSKGLFEMTEVEEMAMEEDTAEALGENVHGHIETSDAWPRPALPEWRGDSMKVGESFDARIMYCSSVPGRGLVKGHTCPIEMLT